MPGGRSSAGWGDYKLSIISTAVQYLTNNNPGPYFTLGYLTLLQNDPGPPPFVPCGLETSAWTAGRCPPIAPLAFGLAFARVPAEPAAAAEEEPAVPPLAPPEMNPLVPALFPPPFSATSGGGGGRNRWAAAAAAAIENGDGGGGSADDDAGDNRRGTLRGCLAPQPVLEGAAMVALAAAAAGADEWAAAAAAKAAAALAADAPLDDPGTMFSTASCSGGTKRTHTHIHTHNRGTIGMRLAGCARSTLAQTSPSDTPSRFRFKRAKTPKKGEG